MQSYHEGRMVSQRSWRSGARGAVFTLAMPAAPKVGDTFVRGQAGNVYEVTDVSAEVTTPAGTFSHCLRARVKSPGENGARERVYAPGVGVVEDGPFKLVKIFDVKTTQAEE